MPPPPRPHFGLALAALVIAAVALGLDRQNALLGHLGFHPVDQHVLDLWHACMAAVFLIFGSIAVRRVATQLGHLLHVGGGPRAGSAIRLSFTIAGLVIVLIVTIGMLGVDPSRLLAAAGITGIILGLAAQQALGNLFAGIILMVARPFIVGQKIRVRSGALGGIFDGTVTSMGLTYVELDTEEDGHLLIPNVAMLAAGVGEPPPPEPDPDAPRLYVNRAIAKRPPRATADRLRKPAPAPRTRLPRDVIRRTRSRRSHPSTGEGTTEEA